MIREAIEAVVSGRSLSMEEAQATMREIMEGQATPAQLGAFLAGLRAKGETPQEIAGMALVMREKSLKVQADGFLVDTCGTGGDGKGTFNISTAAAFVAAGAGLKVAKHGNRAASSTCGSADVLDTLGVKIDLPPQGVKRCIDEVGIGFMFAQVFHPAMKYAAPVRKELGIRTVFNILGPLTNPAGAQAQVLGVAHRQLGATMAQVLGILGSQRAMVVHGEDGLDELTLSGPSFLWELDKGTIRTHRISPEDVGLGRAPLSALKGGSAQENADTLRRLLQGERGPLRDVVLLNTAAVLVVGNAARRLKDGVYLAAASIESGAALDKLEALVKLSQALGNGG